jgi:hypothetical protein
MKQRRRNPNVEYILKLNHIAFVRIVSQRMCRLFGSYFNSIERNPNKYSSIKPTFILVNHFFGANIMDHMPMTPVAAFPLDPFLLFKH